MTNPTQPNDLLTCKVSHPEEDTLKPPDLRITLDHTGHCLAMAVMVFIVHSSNPLHHPSTCKSSVIRSVSSGTWLNLTGSSSDRSPLFQSVRLDAWSGFDGEPNTAKRPTDL